MSESDSSEPSDEMIDLYRELSRIQKIAGETVASGNEGIYYYEINSKNEMILISLEKIKNKLVSVAGDLANDDMCELDKLKKQLVILKKDNSGKIQIVMQDAEELKKFRTIITNLVFEKDLKKFKLFKDMNF